MSGSYPTAAYPTAGGVPSLGPYVAPAQTYPIIRTKFYIKPLTKRVVNFASGVRALNPGNAEVYQIDITHPELESADRDMMLAFYTANRTAINTIDLAGERYSVRYMSDYKPDHNSATRTTLTVSMVGTL
jgi:hypothetical protein